MKKLFILKTVKFCINVIVGMSIALILCIAAIWYLPPVKDSFTQWQQQFLILTVFICALYLLSFSLGMLYSICLDRVYELEKKEIRNNNILDSHDIGF